MNFGNMGFTEIMLILVLVLLLFGAKRLPEIGASMGKGIREFKRSITDVDRQLKEPERDFTRSESRSASETLRDEEKPEPKRLLN
jgi:sec-independent protein translocase protein TatA